MRRRALRRTLAVIVLIVCGLLGLLAFLVTHEPSTYRRISAPTGPERRKLSGEFLSGISDMRDRTILDANWQETFTADQMNSYFEEDFLRAKPFKLPEGVHSPRVSIGPGHFQLAFRYGRGFWSSVITVDLNIWLVPREPNVVAVELLGLHAGSVPISLQAWLDQITENARQLNIGVTWYRHNGNPVALVKFEADKEQPTMMLHHLELQEGKILIAGQTSESSPLRAMLTTGDVLGR